MEKKIDLTKKQKKLFIIIGTIIAVYLGFEYLLPLFVPFLLAYFIAWMLRPFVSMLHRKLKIPLALGAGIGVLLFLGVVCGILLYIGKMLTRQLVLFLKNIPVYQSYLTSQVHGLCLGCDRLFNKEIGASWEMLSRGSEALTGFVQDAVLPRITSQTLRFACSAVGLFTGMVIVIVASILFIKDMEEYKEGLRKSEFYPAVHRITKKLSETGIAYLKTQLMIMSIIAVLCVGALWILKNPYALLIGIGIAVFDAFPVLGSGLILIPWTLVMLLSKNVFAAAVLITLYILCQLTREFLEPKLLGNKIGIQPIYSLMSMYIGLQLFGVFGFFLGPLGLVIIRTVVKTYAGDTKILFSDQEP
ncbi:MAG: sporulation integral membrane protein YtvI [Lachnospiraceae bacterium]|nr:sporulation integral membrane protein YtvI [Lachnospiraceae bacterium]